MHEDLIGAAARRGLGWSLAGAVLAAAGPAAFVLLVAAPAAAVVAFVVSVAALGGWMVAGAAGVPSSALPRSGLRPADAEVTNLAEGIGLARGSVPAAAWLLDHPQPNVAAFEQGERDLLVVTSGAVAGLTRDELEAVCAAQLAIAHDRTCQRLEGRLTAWRLARAATFLTFIPLTIAISANPRTLGALAALTVPPELAGWLVAGKVRWWARVAADGVCVSTTRHPEALVAALRKLSHWNGAKVPVGWLTKLTGAGGSRWAVAIGPNWTMTTQVNGRTTDQRTAEQVEDVNLLVRAGLVRRVRLEGGAPSLASRSQVVDAVHRAGRAAAVGGAAEVEGVLVGLGGVVGVAAVAEPAPGWYPDPTASGMLRWWDGDRWTTHQSPAR